MVPTDTESDVAEETDRESDAVTQERELATSENIESVEEAEDEKQEEETEEESEEHESEEIADREEEKESK